MFFGNSSKEEKSSNALRISQPFDPRHMSAAPGEPTLPRLTRLGLPSLIPSAEEASTLPLPNKAAPPLPSLDTSAPPLPLPQSVFNKSRDPTISPSVYSVSSSRSSRRRSSDESSEGRPPSSRSSATSHDGYAAFKHVPWGGYSPVGTSSRKGSGSSQEASPRESSPSSRGPSHSSSQVPPRRPVGGHPPPRGQSPHRMSPPQPRPNNFHDGPSADPRTFLRTPSPTPDTPRGRSSPEPSAPTFRSARAQSPLPSPSIPGSRPPRANSPLTREFKGDGFVPPPIRHGHPSPPSSLRNVSMSTNDGPGPVFSPSVASPGLSSRSFTPRTPPPQRLQTSQLPQSPRSFSQPASPTEQPYSESEVVAIWSHASLLYHNGRVPDAMAMLRTLHERPGASELTFARLHINIGIMMESIAKGHFRSRESTTQSKDSMINSYETAIKHSPEGPEGALATFLLGCSLFDSSEFDKSASCFDMCEAIFAGESDVMNYRASANQPWSDQSRPSALQGSEKIDLSSMGIEWDLFLSFVRENWRVASERARIPAALGTLRGLHRLPQGLIVEEPTPRTPPALSPLDESDEEEETMSVRDTLGLKPDESELIPMQLDLSPQPAGPPVRRRTTKKQDREEMERRREARRTRILIKLGDLRLNKPLPPLPHEKEAMKRAQTPQVPPLPIATVHKGMAFV